MCLKELSVHQLCPMNNDKQLFYIHMLTCRHVQAHLHTKMPPKCQIWPTHHFGIIVALMQFSRLDKSSKQQQQNKDEKKSHTTRLKNCSIECGRVSQVALGQQTCEYESYFPMLFTYLIKYKIAFTDLFMMAY